MFAGDGDEAARLLLGEATGVAGAAVLVALVLLTAARSSFFGSGPAVAVLSGPLTACVGLGVACVGVIGVVVEPRKGTVEACACDVV